MKSTIHLSTAFCIYSHFFSTSIHTGQIHALHSTYNMPNTNDGRQKQKVSAAMG